MTTYAEPLSFEEIAVRELAAWLAARIPYLSWYDDKAASADPAYTYPDEQWGMYVGLYPPGPANSITLADYVVSDDPSLSDSVMGVQFAFWHRDGSKLSRARGDVFDLLHGRQRTMLGAVTLVSAARSSGTNVGQDSTGRLGRTESYYLTVHRPSTNRQ